MDDNLLKYETGYVTRNQVIRLFKITPVTFEKWRKGSSICPPLPHEKVFPEGWKSYRIVIPEKEFMEWLEVNKPWMLHDKKDYQNWRKYKISQKVCLQET